MFVQSNTMTFALPMTNSENDNAVKHKKLYAQITDKSPKNVITVIIKKKKTSKQMSVNSGRYSTFIDR